MIALPPLAFSKGPRHTGAALIVVLCLLILLTGLVVAFFSSVTTETESAATTRQQVELHHLKDLPVEMVKAQIRSATTLNQVGEADEVTHTWASQPGLLRVFDREGDLARAFKLYSSSRMEETDTQFIATDIPADWNTLPNRYVDLNQPFPSLTVEDETVYPILDPAAAGWAEGVAISPDPAGIGHATMPVEWLYVLEDGSLVSYDDLGDAGNPPVARIAFWADDESCKVNINTAGERTFWDRPRTGHHLNYQFRYNQPSTGEYNAYPGHPATVSLSAVFGNRLEVDSDAERVETMLGLTPRYAWGGSKNGSIATYEPRVELDRTKPNAEIRNDRLFASDSEFILKADRTLSREDLLEPIEKSGFLLTESSRAPELNLFGMPRVGLWPIDQGSGKRTVYDQLIARATTIGSQPFYFQRSDPFSTAEATGISRNFDLLQYLDTITQLPVPGFGGSFATKYTRAGNRQILTEMFDYIRAGTNLSDTSRPESEFHLQFTPAATAHSGYVLPSRIPAWGARGFGRVPVITNIGVVLYAYAQRGYLGAAPAELPPTAETDVHLMLWFNFISPMLGVAPFSTTYKIVLKQYTLGVSEVVAPEQEPNLAMFTMRSDTSNRFVFTDQGKDWGGYETMLGQGSGQVRPSGPPLLNGYEFHSAAPVTLKGNLFNFHGGTLELEVYDESTDTLLQTYTLTVPSSSVPWPMPIAWQATDAVPDQPPPAVLFWNRNPQTTQDLVPSPTANYVLGTRRMDGANARELDVIRGIELAHGDARLVACMDHVPASLFQPSKGYYDGSRRIACSLLFTRTISSINRVFHAEFGKFVNARFHDETQVSSNPNYSGMLSRPPLPAEVNGTPLTSLRDMGWSGDIDGGMLGEPDGPFLNKPDEGFIATLDPATGTQGTQDPYYRSMSVDVNGRRIRSWDPRTNGFFSPTRQMPSAVQLGSLPTGVAANAPWRTLLFSPNSQAAMVPDGDGNTGHPGAESPHDHLYLDLFTMPVVEPYAISEPFSTAGKINLNQRVIPFTHIRRETGLYALLKNLSIGAVDSDDNAIAPWYKSPNTSDTRWHLLRGVDVPATVAEVARVLDPSGRVAQGAFRSASEICNLFLIPSDLGGETLAGYWSRHQLTADNVREAPYNYLYPLLTTQSNTYLVHYRVQTLTVMRRRAGFDPAKDFVVSGEHRGSTLLERYLDVHDSRFGGANPEVDATEHALNEYYQFRVLRHSTFTPGL